MSNPEAGQIWRGLHYLQTFLDVHYHLVLPVLIMIPVLVRVGVRIRTARGEDQQVQGRVPSAAARLPVDYLFFLLIAYTVYIVLAGGDWSLGRFFVPLLPVVYLLAAVGGWQLSRLLQRLAGRNPALTALLVALLLLPANLWTSSYRGERRLYALSAEMRVASEARRAAGKWLRQNAPPDALLAVDATGQIPYYSGLNTIDLYGLTDAHVAHQPATLGEGVAGHERMDLDYVLEQEPDFFVVYGRSFDFLVPPYRRVEDWTRNPAYERYLSIYRR